MTNTVPCAVYSDVTRSPIVIIAKCCYELHYNN